MTLSTSPNKNNNRMTSIQIAWKYGVISVLCAAIGAVYEYFSFGVYAYGMLYAFAFPLFLGLLPALLFAKTNRKLPPQGSRPLWHFGVSALTVGSFFSGALEIYGTASSLTKVYWFVGVGLLLLALLIWGLQKTGRAKEEPLQAAGVAQ